MKLPALLTKIGVVVFFSKRWRVMRKECVSIVNGLILIALVTALEGFPQSASSDDAKRLQMFEKQVDDLRQRLRIPGMSVGIVKDQKLVWAKGFGYADVENKVPATPDTLFHLASITKTFASMLIMQLVEQGKLDLDEPMSRYSTDFKDDSVKVKHIITHTSAGTPGESFRYNGNRYGYLTAVIEKKTGKKFTEMVAKTFFEPLGMTESVPYHKIVDESDKWLSSLGNERLDHYKENLTKFAQPYTYYGAGETVHTTYPYPEYNGVSAGILSTVVDMAKYDAAIDRHVFIKKETQEKAWTPFVANSGKRLPYGLGWFVMDQHGHKLVWHTGDWGSGFSALLLKIPEKDVSLILLANSEALIEHQYSVGEVMVDDAIRNVFACSFLNLWGLAYDCESTSNTAMTTFIEQRRISGRTAIRVDPKILDSYVGKYQFERLANGIFTVTRDGDKLNLTGPGTKTDMFADSVTTFFSKIMPWRLIFTKAERQPAQLSIVRGDQTYNSKRVE
jgi:CubicO group peptidase (beta-lactamase class C family)